MQSDTRHKNNFYLSTLFRCFTCLMVSLIFIEPNFTYADDVVAVEKNIGPGGSDAFATEGLPVFVEDLEVSILDGPGSGSMGDYYNGFDMCDSGQDGIPYGPCGPGQQCMPFPGGGNVCVCSGDHCDPPDGCEPPDCPCVPGTPGCGGCECPPGQQPLPYDGPSCAPCCPVAQICDDQCCAAGKFCNSGQCQDCPAQEISCGTECCPPGQSCLNGQCLSCPDSQQCGDQCCPDGHECINGECSIIVISCEPEEVICGDVCCAEGLICQNPEEGICVPEEECPLERECGEVCCAEGDSCHDPVLGLCEPSLCLPGEILCGENCCKAGEICQDDGSCFNPYLIIRK